MQKLKQVVILGLISTLFLVGGCHQKDKPKTPDQAQASSDTTHSNVLAHLTFEEKKANYALPFCEKENCIDVEIQSLITNDAWFNQWIEQRLAYIIQAQIDQNKKLSLQQAINAYIAQSDRWQEQYSKNQAYELHVKTRIAMQRDQYALLQIGLNSKQEGVNVQDRYYFFVADRKLQKNVTILDILQKNQHTYVNQIVQENYKKWLKQQPSEVQAEAPPKLYWGQADWFFDQEGIGLHYRANEISKQAGQFDIYLTKAQTKTVLIPEIYQKMF